MKTLSVQSAMKLYMASIKYKQLSNVMKSFNKFLVKALEDSKEFSDDTKGFSET